VPVSFLCAELSSFVSRLVTHYLCGSSERLDDGLELEVIDEEQEVGNGETGEAENDGSEVG
jgi:hypothetical protein